MSILILLSAYYIIVYLATRECTGRIKGRLRLERIKKNKIARMDTPKLIENLNYVNKRLKDGNKCTY